MKNSFYRNLLTYSFLSLTTLLTQTACDKGTTADPSTNDQGEFNPPGQLQSKTGDSNITLRWVAANAEKEFQGYHVFASTKSLSELKALVKYPTYTDATTKKSTAADISVGQSIPRCKDNSEFFIAFGFKATDAECKSTVKAETAASLFEGYKLANSADAAAEEGETIDFNVKCDGETSTNVSRVGTTTGKGLGPMTCKVTSLANGTKLANGTTYSFFVVAVKGGSFNNISWISNVIEDTPAKLSFSEDVTVSSSKYVEFTVNTTTFAISKGSEKACTDAICKITESNGGTETKIFLARDNDTGYPMRLMVSATGGFTMQARGPQTMDPDAPDTVSTTIPGDEAAAVYDPAGTKYAVYGNQVFDIELTIGSTKYYGKMVFKNISYTDVKSTSTNATVNVTIILQPKATSRHYLHSGFESENLEF